MNLNMYTYLYITTYHELVDDASLSDTGTEIKKKIAFTHKNDCKPH